MARSILVVDDDETDVMFLRQALEARIGDVAICHAASGEEGLAHLRAHTPDLVLLDLKMPGTSGLEVLSAIRLDERLRRTKVVVLSSSHSRSDVRSSYENAANAYVTKPTSLGGYLKMAESLGRFWLDSALTSD